MTITYSIGDNLYINMTNNCTNDCDFCVRMLSDTVSGSPSLRLDREPTRDEIIADIVTSRPQKYRELVFCGFGEPTCRLDDMLYVCGEVRRLYPGLRIRLNTNGHASLINGKNTAPMFDGLLDSISISLNHRDAESYAEMCRPQFGERAFEALLDFTREIKKYVPEVTLSALDLLSGDDIDACRAIADSLGVRFYVRHYATA